MGLFAFPNSCRVFNPYFYPNLFLPFLENLKAFLYKFAKDVITKFPKWNGLNHGNLSSRSCGGWKSPQLKVCLEIKVSVGGTMFSLKALGKDLFHVS
jgi:hypothetical protein